MRELNRDVADGGDLMNDDDYDGSDSIIPLNPPLVSPTPELSDSLLVETMNRLSMNEKEEAFADLHGIAEVNEEAPDFIEQKLSDLDKVILKLAGEGGGGGWGNNTSSAVAAYNVARSMSSSYVSSRKIRLQFLRAHAFNVDPAARRLFDFFELKLELFGKEKLTKDIELCDLDDEDMKCLESGWVQLNPERDSTGRSILTVIPIAASAISKSCTPENKLRSAFYIFMSAAGDEEIQKRGGVAIFCETKHVESMHSAPWRMGRLFRIMPVRCAACHFCFNDTNLKWLMSLAVLVGDPRIHPRIRQHSGGQLEMIYKLMTFGIPAEAFPLSPTGEVKRGAALEFIKQRREVEAKTASGQPKKLENSKIHPEEVDILLGRGRNFRNHPGNVRFHHIVEMHETQYENSSRYGKQLLSDSVLKIVKQDGARFLKKNSATGWFEVGDEVARERVCHAFRNRRLLSARTMDSRPSKEKLASVLSAGMNPSGDNACTCFGFNIGLPITPS